MFLFFGQRIVILKIFKDFMTTLKIESGRAKELFTTLEKKQFAPYESSNGWAETFLGLLILHFYEIPADSFCVNGVPSNAIYPADIVLLKNSYIYSF